jgi:hypothetical protein
MDCEPPAGAKLRPAMGHASAMNIDTHQPQRSSLPTTMDCDVLSPPPPCTLDERQHFQRHIAVVAMDHVEACFEWLSVHTHYSVPANRAAFRHLYTAGASLRGSPSETAVRYQLKCLLHVSDANPLDDPGSRPGPGPDPRCPFPLPGPRPSQPPRPRQPPQPQPPSQPPPSPPKTRTTRRSSIPHGFEAEAVRMAAATALPGPPARRLTRATTQPTEWWRSTPPHSNSDTSLGPPVTSRRPDRR